MHACVEEAEKGPSAGGGATQGPSGHGSEN